MAPDGFLTDPQPLLDFRSFNPVGIPGQLVTRVAEGITYYFALGSGSTTGPRTGVMRVHFRLDPVPDAPANDFFSQRAILSGTDLTVSGDVTWATGERQEPAQAGEKTLWWEWTAPQDGVLRLNVTANWRLIRTLDHNSYSLSIVRSIVTFAKEQELEVVAEFVENEAIFEIVKELGIEYSQGYLFGKPERFP